MSVEPDISMNYDLISFYFDEVPKLESRIHDYFGYQERWRVAPLDDCREHYWIVDRDTVYFSKEKITDLDSGALCSNYILPDHQGKRIVMRSTDYTAILADTQTDGNIFLSIFDNTKEININDLEANSRL